MTERLIGVATALLLVVGCGGDSVGNKPDCGAPGSCSAGNFCAQTGEGNFCWPDTTPPVISSLSVTCSKSPCLRDSVLTVSATVTDESYGNAMGSVKVSLDLDPTHPLTLNRVSAGGNEYRVEVRLEDLPFPYWTHDVGGAVTATDEAANLTSPKELTAVSVVRAKWSLALPGSSGVFPLSSPAIVDDGRILVAGGDGTLFIVPKDGQTFSSASLGGAVNGPPAVGAGAIWLAGQDGVLRKRALADGSAITLTDCATTAGTALLGPPAILGDRVVSSSSGSEVLVARTTNSCNVTTLSGLITSTVSIDKSGRVLLTTDTSLRQFTVAASSGLVDAWASVPAPVVGNTTEPLAIDWKEDSIWSTAASGAVFRTTSAGAASQVSTAPAMSSTGPIILSDKTAVVADNAGSVRRFNRDGTSPWATTPTVSGHPRIPLALGGATPSLLVPTSDGSIYLLKQSTGEVIWSTKLGPQGLQPANIWTESGAKTSTAYLASSNGMLYAVIVDGALDKDAPWPKAYHDPQNTSNAGTAF